MRSPPPLHWMTAGDDFPPVDAAWPMGTSAPGLLAAGGDLSVQNLLRAYRRGIFPWFSEGDPILWWSTDPRMVLETGAFRLHRSLNKTLRNFVRTPAVAIRVDYAFSDVIAACAAPRVGATGTWIVPSMARAYDALHQQVTRTVWKPGSMTGWWVACTSSLWVGQCLVSRCLPEKQTPQKLHWLRWFACAANTESG